MRPLVADPLCTDLPPCRIPDVVPVLPVRDAVPFPERRMVLAVGRPRSLAALARARDPEVGHVLVVAQRDRAVDDPGPDDLYPMGCVARLVADTGSDETARGVLLVCVARAIPVALLESEPTLVTDIALIDEPLDSTPPCDAATRAALFAAAERVRQIALGETFSEARAAVARLRGVGRAADLIIGHFALPVAEQQAWLEELDVERRVRFVLDPGAFGHPHLEVVREAPRPSLAARVMDRLRYWVRGDE